MKNSRCDYFIYPSLFLLLFLFTHCQSESAAPRLSISNHDSLKKSLPLSIRYVMSDDTVSPPQVLEPEKIRKPSSFTNDPMLIGQYIRRIFQDKKGKLWFGMVNEGLCRYDGEVLQYFTKAQGLRTCSVQEIKEDAAGNIWFATTDGLIRFDGKIFQRLSTANGLPDNHIQSLLIERSGKVWVGTGKGLAFYESASNDSIHFNDFPFPEVDEKKEVSCLLEDDNGNIWFSAKKSGLYWIEKARGMSLHHLGTAQGLPSLQINHLLQDNKGIIWLATTGAGLCSYDPHAITADRYQFRSFREEKGSNECWYLMKDKKNNLWVSVRGSVRCYNLKDNSISANKFINYGFAEGLKNACVQSICEDATGLVWLGSGEGLYRLTRSASGDSCLLKICLHNLQEKSDLQKHQDLLSKIILPVRKNSNWPRIKSLL